VLRRNVQHLHAAILLWVPPKFVIDPFLKHEDNTSQSSAERAGTVAKFVTGTAAIMETLEAMETDKKTILLLDCKFQALSPRCILL
jgi:hypothetical protein